MIRTFHDVVLLWGDGDKLEPAAHVLAGDIAVKIKTVLAWVHRGSIPAEYWDSILTSASNRGLPLSADDMVRAAARHAGSRPKKNDCATPSRAPVHA